MGAQVVAATKADAVDSKGAKNGSKNSYAAGAQYKVSDDVTVSAKAAFYPGYGAKDDATIDVAYKQKLSKAATVTFGTQLDATAPTGNGHSYKIAFSYDV